MQIVLVAHPGIVQFLTLTSASALKTLKRCENLEIFPSDHLIVEGIHAILLPSPRSMFVAA
jgi:hypothetical protein